MMHDYGDLTKQLLTALSEERREMIKASNETSKEIGTERTALVQAFSDLTKQQLTTLSEERKDIAKIAAALLHDASADRQILIGALQKVTAEEHGQNLDLLKPVIEKARR